MSIRSGMVCNLNMARLFWKHLTSDDISENDLEVIDDALFERIKQWREARDSGMLEDHFKAGFDLKFVDTRADGSETPLCKDGQSKEVTYANLD